MATKTLTGTDEQRASEANGLGKNQKQKKDLHSLLEVGLKDIYSAEQQLVEALPEIARAADSEELEEAVTFHLEQTRKHVSRLEKVFDRLNISRDNIEKCAAMEGLIEEGKRVIQEFERSPVRDSALIIGSQKIEHYEIAAYGSLCELADVLGEDRICELLERTLEEEKDTDRSLTEIAQEVNDEAYELSEHDSW